MGRVMFMAMPSPAVQAAVLQAVDVYGVRQQLGRSLFAPSNWHQSFSERVFDASTAQIDALLAVGQGLIAPGGTLRFDRIDWSTNQTGRIHCTLRGPAANRQAMLPLLTILRGRLHAAGFADIATGVTAHLTLSYGAPTVQPRLTLPTPIDWTFDELLLVSGEGQPYHYRVLGRWPLLPDPDPPATQLGLF